MKNKYFILNLLLVAIFFATVSTSCNKDDSTPAALTLESIVAGDVDLNGATSATTVSVLPTIVATFSTDIDATTATAANIKLTRKFDNADIAFSITTSGKTITMIPSEELYSGALYELLFNNYIKSTGGSSLSALLRSFSTIGTFVPPGQIAYWSFEDNADDQVGAWDPAAADIIDMTYSASRKTSAGKAATFNGSTSLIEIPNGDDLMNTADFTLAFWVKTNSADKTNGHFVMGLAGWNGLQFEIYGAYDGCKLAAQYDLGNSTSASEDLWYNGQNDLGWQGWTFAKDLTGSGGLEFLIKDKWAHIVCVYNAATKVGTMYINGEKMKSQDFNLWPDGEPKRGVVGLKYNGDPLGNNLALGFIQGRNNRTITDPWADYADPAGNHFKGQLDDIRIFHIPLSATEVNLMYNSEK